MSALASLAGVTWRTVHPNAGAAPAWAIPAEADLAGAVSAALTGDGASAGEMLRAWQAATDRLRRLCADDDAVWVPTRDGRLLAVAAVATATVEEVLAAYPRVPERLRRFKHPLAPIIAAWQRHVARPTPEPTAEPRELARLHRANEDDAHRLFALPEPTAAAGEQLLLPGIGGASLDACPSWLLAVYDATGGPGRGGGRGAPRALRLWVAAFLHARPEPGWQDIAVTGADLGRWLHPAGQRGADDWQRLGDALRVVHGLRVEIPGVGLVAPVVVPVIPTGPRDVAALRVFIPAGAERGARIDWPLLREHGAESAALYRLHLSAAAVLDHTARHGHPVTATIPAVERRADGRPRRDKAGRIMRRTDGETEPHPHLGAVPTFAGAELARMAGLDAGRRNNLTTARGLLDRLAADGIIAPPERLPGARDTWRILGPAAPRSR